MSESLRKRAETIFNLLVGLLPEERSIHLDQMCGPDPELRAEVELLLDVYDSSDLTGFMETSYRREAIGRIAGESWATTLITGQDVAGYELLRVLGQGGQATVFLAQDPKLNRHVALKLLPRALTTSDSARMRFSREAEAASKLDHPNICRVYGVGETEDGAPYLVMEYVEGEPLNEKISASSSRAKMDSSIQCVDLDHSGDQAGVSTQSSPDAPAITIERNDINTILQTIEQTAHALHAAHERGLVHRDIKPGNLMVRPDGQPVILDFGLARDEDSDTPSLTQSGDLLGTPAYMSPEQIEPTRTGIDRRADVYSLGVVLYECLTLKPPFEAPTRQGLYRAIMTEELPDPRTLNRAISRDLLAVIQTASEKDRDRRYQTANAFARDLCAAREGRPVSVKPISAVGRAMRWAKRKPAVAGLLMVLLVGLPVVTVLILERRANLEQVREAEKQRLQQEIRDHLAQGFMKHCECRPADAIQSFEKAIALAETSSPEAVAGLAMATLSNTFDPEEALGVIDRFGSLLEKHAGLRHLKASLLRWSGNEESALKLEATVKEPTCASDLFLRGWLSFTQISSDGQIPKETVWRGMLNDFTKAILYADRPVLIYFYMRAIAAMGCKDMEAIHESARIMNMHWGDLEFVSLTCDLLSSVGSEGSSDGHNGQVRSALKLNPNSGISHASALLTANSGQPDLTIRAFEEAIHATSSPRQRACYHVCLSSVLRRAGRLDDAIGAARNAVRQQPEFGIFRFQLVNLLVRADRIEEALSICKTPIKEKLIARLVYCSLGHALIDKGRLDEAGTLYDQASRLKTGFAILSAELGCELGKAFLEKDLVDKAIAIFRDAVRLKPDHARAHAKLGDALFRRGLIKEAIEAHEEATRLDPGYIPAILPHIEQVVCNILKQSTISHRTKDEIHIAFFGVLNKTGENLGDVVKALYEVIDTTIGTSDRHRCVDRRLLVNALRQTRLRTDQLNLRANRKKLVALLSEMSNPIDFFLFSTIIAGSPGTTDLRPYQFTVAFELVNAETGEIDSKASLVFDARKEMYIIYTHNAENFYNLGCNAIHDGKVTEAEKNFRQSELHFKKALDFIHNSFKAHLGVGLALLHQENRVKLLEAVDFLEKADNIRRDDWRVHYGLARAHQLLARLDGDLIDQLEGLKRKVKGVKQEEVSSRIQETKHGRMDNLKKAVAEANLIVKCAQDKHQAYLILGTTYAELHEYDKAIPNLKTYLTMVRTTREASLKWKQNKTRPRGVSGPEGELDKLIMKNLKQDAEAKALLGTIYKNRGEWLKSLEYLDSIYEVNPLASPKYLPLRAYARAKLGDYKGAVKDMDQFLKKLGASNHNYDAVVRRAMEEREKYAKMLRLGSVKTKPGQKNP